MNVFMKLKSENMATCLVVCLFILLNRMATHPTGFFPWSCNTKKNLTVRGNDNNGNAFNTNGVFVLSLKFNLKLLSIKYLLYEVPICILRPI